MLEVIVENPHGHPVPVRDVDAAAHIVAARAEPAVPQNVTGASTPIYTVPQGMRLIVDHLSASCSSTAGQDITFGISGSANGGLPAQLFPPTINNWDPAGLTLYAMSAPLHLLYDSGSVVSVGINRSVGGGLQCPQLSTVFYLSGRLVPAL